jgi:hypothetical protein
MEVCICAAILCQGKIYRGHRHSDALLAMHNELSWNMSRKEIMELKEVQGFLTSLGRFVSREEGMELQLSAGIASADPGGYRSGELYSEDLY